MRAGIENFHLQPNREVSCYCCSKVTSVVSDSVRPHRRQPTRLPRPWDSPGKNTGVGCHFLLQCRKVKRKSEVAQSCPTLATPWTAAYQAPPPMGFFRQEYWSGVPLPSPLLKTILMQMYSHIYYLFFPSFIPFFLFLLTVHCLEQKSHDAKDF